VRGEVQAGRTATRCGSAQSISRCMTASMRPTRRCRSCPLAPRSACSSSLGTMSELNGERSG
jgi:hypothetical protein